MNRLSLVFNKFKENKSALTVGEIVDGFGVKGLPVTTLFFIVPFLQPVPLPGISTPFGLLIALNGLGIAFSAQMWLPKKVKEIQIEAEWLIKISNAAVYVLSRMEKVTKTRYPQFVQSSRPLTGLLIFLLGVFLALPLALPFTNSVPAFIILFLALGLAEEDAFLIAVGYLSFTLSLATLAAAIDIIIKVIQDYLEPVTK